MQKNAVSVDFSHTLERTEQLEASFKHVSSANALPEAIDRLFARGSKQAHQASA